LGLKKIKLDLDDDEIKVKEKLISDVEEDGVVVGFPKLRSCGGFEMMQCNSNCRNLTVIGVNWSAKSLKSCMGGSQAKIYLRPIQKSLSTKPLHDEITESLIKEECHICHKEVYLRELRTHMWTCADNAIQQPSEDDDYMTDDALAIPDDDLVPGNEQVSNSLHASTSSQTISQPPVITIPDNETITPSLPADQNEMSSLNSNADTQQENEVEEAIRKTLLYCREKNVVNPVEILRCLQKNVVIGRALDVEDPSQVEEGATNFIIVDRNNLLNTAFDEIGGLENPRLTLEVQFYGEVCSYYL
jgi:hypothetical protein